MKVKIVDLLIDKLEICRSTSEARRLIKMGGFKFNNTRITNESGVVDVEVGSVIKVGNKEIEIVQNTSTRKDTNMGKITTCIICGVSYFHSDYDEEECICSYCRKNEEDKDDD
jgi:ribosomal protein S4